MKKILFVVMLLSLPFLLFSLTLRRTTLEKLQRNTDLVIYGSVLATHSAWDEKHEFIWTESEVEINDVLKGSWTLNRITISQLGGRIGDTGLEVPGVELLAPGDEVILFVRRFRGRYRIESMELGKFTIYTDKAGGEKKIRTIMPAEDIFGIDLAKKSSRAPELTQVLFKDFINRIRTISE